MPKHVSGIYVARIPGIIHIYVSDCSLEYCSVTCCTGCQSITTQCIKFKIALMVFDCISGHWSLSSLLLRHICSAPAKTNAAHAGLQYNSTDCRTWSSYTLGLRTLVCWASVCQCKLHVTSRTEKLGFFIAPTCSRHLCEHPFKRHLWHASPSEDVTNDHWIWYGKLWQRNDNNQSC